MGVSEKDLRRLEDYLVRLAKWRLLERRRLARLAPCFADNEV
jgi:hypothetical protein